MLAESAENQRSGSDVPKLRTACENCRQSKVKCNISGKSMCTRCLRNGLQCQYGFANRSGKPKGSKNRATLRKLGELPDEKRPVRAFRATARGGSSAIRREPLLTRGVLDSSVNLATLEGGGCLIPGQSDIWDCPVGLANGPLLVPMSPSLMSPSLMLAMGDSPLIDRDDLASPVTPSFMTFDPPELCMISPPQSDSVSSPYAPLSLCECKEMQLHNLSRLGQLLASPQSLRFDQTLQMIKMTLEVGRVFLQCQLCAKDYSNLLLLTSILNTVVQLFERIASRETRREPQAGQDNTKYGSYEIYPGEANQIQGFLLRGSLQQCKDVLSMLVAAVKVNLQARSSLLMLHWDASQEIDEAWISSDDYFPPAIKAEVEDEADIEWMSGMSSEMQHLMSVIAGFEVSLDRFLQSISLGQCVCDFASILD
ncbi:Fungal Zn(2)-Cys(6) binuclear cluster domain-containing protein [Penicillium ucsense]|uniref:Fungal Zn(2)-Cys(6) binuclear cluster domain-containing protein n=1 Tax=Penicillium ucsense TaxID=2839758 RepID=A0A8J8VZE7_9EURO|nr:Fungal Zn(2)-Cys(6) binuclear cluster domain-containing protein [Penicillium ucsense]KAF7734222.1 Fungal Zn(2)-Cys(6) binuclear cluster domain-containing protein [Penicillium ucsense]